jgi:hypothetical protein
MNWMIRNALNGGLVVSVLALVLTVWISGMGG